ncbi:MAG: hypothetical protein U9N39_01810 [Campylobacterota bacterium]|nr:hypothetical protein [Campylobacterota bacterium]
MKSILLLLMVLFSSANANEVQRIESIVEDINRLRSDYAKLDDQLSVCKHNLKDEQEKNKILKKETDSLNNQLKKANTLLKTKEKNCKIIKNRLNKKTNNRVDTDKCLNTQIIKSENTFPKLQMKEQYESTEIEAQVVYFKPSSFRLNKEAKIYDGIDANVISTWEELTSFTSNQGTADWIKITGYFVDKVWRPSKRDMWIKQSDAKKRGN